MLNWSNTIKPNIGYRPSKRRKSTLSNDSDLPVLQTLAMFLKLLFVTFEILNKVLVLISQVAAINQSDNIYPNIGWNPSKTPKIDIFGLKSYVE